MGERPIQESPEQLRRKRILKSGGIGFRFQHPDGHTEDVAVQLAIRHVLQPDKEGRVRELQKIVGVEVEEASTWELNGANFQFDLSDAPVELQAAVRSRYAHLCERQEQLAKGKPQGELLSEEQTMLDTLQRIVRAMDEAAMKRSAAAEKRSKGKLEEPATEKKARQPEMTPAQRRSLLERAFGKMDDAVYKLSEKRGAFLVFRDKEVFAVQLEPVTRDQEITGWRVNTTAGRTSVNVGRTFEFDLSNMPALLKAGFDRTVEALGDSADGLLKQMRYLNVHGPELQKKAEEARRKKETARMEGAWAADTKKRSLEAFMADPKAMKVGETGRIRWHKLEDGRWGIFDVINVPEVTRNDIFRPDLSDAPKVVQDAAKGYFVRGAKGVYTDISHEIPDTDEKTEKAAPPAQEVADAAK